MHIRDVKSCALILSIWACMLLSFSVVNADVSIAVGPTTIPRGDATGAADITVSNDIFAIAFAVDTAPPWGVARGGIVDIAPVRDGKVGYDIASLADFMPNKWSSWPTTYQRVTIESDSPSEALIKTVRDWGDVDLETTFHIRDGDSKIRIITRMTNNGDESLNDLHSGYVVWPDGGSLYGMPGVPATSVSLELAALGDWSASYGEHWVLGLHAPFSQVLAYDGRDRYRLHDLAAGEARTFEAWLQIENDGTLAPLVQAEIDLLQLPSGRLSGRVMSDDMKSVPRPAVVVMQGGKQYAWTLGNDGKYEIALPAGDYQVYATAKGYAQGETKSVTISDGSEITIDFDDVRPPGAIHVRVVDKATGHALDARVGIREGYTPTIAYFGKSTFFTELDSVGETTQEIAPGRYVLAVSAGAGFVSLPRRIDLVVEPGETNDMTVEIPIIAQPKERGWYNADLHHHSDVLDGFTEAEFVMRSELAARVDIAFLSDHDSVVNNEKMQAMAEARGLDFIPGAELSPSWAHFNAYPLDDGKLLDIDTGQATVQELFAAAREMGADVIEVNHPYSTYGYFESLEKDRVPGGFAMGFDVVEIEPHDFVRNTKTMERVWRLWNDGQKIYLAAGSDAHNVWIDESGSARTYVHVDGALTIEKFIDGLKSGHAFASQGPLIYPEILFGDEVEHSAGDKLDLKYSIQAVSGLRSVALIERGDEIDQRLFDGANSLTPVSFSVSPEADTWYSLVVSDIDGKFAYSNPLWVNVEEK